MGTTQHEQATAKTTKELEDVIARAIRKIDGRKENDLCKFLPMTKGGYMHHFTLRKMRNEAPEKLSDMIHRYIINADAPGKVAPKPRAARGSRKKRDILSLARTDVDRLIEIVRQSGDKEMISKLSPKRNTTAVRRDLMRSIREGRADQDLWTNWTEAVATAHGGQQHVNNAARFGHAPSQNGTQPHNNFVPNHVTHSAFAGSHSR